MKKLLIAFMCLTAFSLNACDAPGNSNPGNPDSGASASPNPDSGASGDPFASKASFLAFIKCVNAKFPETVGPSQGYINQLNSLSDDRWPSVKDQYRTIANPYLNKGCN